MCCFQPIHLSVPGSDPWVLYHKRRKSQKFHILSTGALKLQNIGFWLGFQPLDRSFFVNWLLSYSHVRVGSPSPQCLLLFIPSLCRMCSLTVDGCFNIKLLKGGNFSVFLFLNTWTYQQDLWHQRTFGSVSDFLGLVCTVTKTITVKIVYLCHYSHTWNRNSGARVLLGKF